MASEEGFDFIIRARPPGEVMYDGYEIEVPPDRIWRNIDLEHEFYFVETMTGEIFWGYLYDYTEGSLDLSNCYKWDRNSNAWKEFGFNDYYKNRLSINYEQVKAIKKAPYSAKHVNDYGARPFTDKKNDEDDDDE